MDGAVMTYNDRQLEVIDARVRSAARLDAVVGTLAVPPANTTDTTCLVVVDPSAQAEEVKILGGVRARAGDRVVMKRWGSDWVVVDSFVTRLPSDDGVSVDGGVGGNTTSSTFAPIPSAAAFTFTKWWDDTRIKATSLIGSWANGTGSIVEFRANLDGGSYTHVLCGQPHNTASEHRYCGRINYLSGVPAGTYAVAIEWRRVSGADQILHDSNDVCSVNFTEVEP